MMVSMSVSNIIIKPLKIFRIKDGDVLHALKRSEKSFNNFGEVYFSKINKGSIKGWKIHQKMTLNLVVPLGEVEFVFYDSKNDCKIVRIGEKNYSRITVPPQIWFAFKGLSSPVNLIMNIADIEHDPAEVERKSIEYINHTWT